MSRDLAEIGLVELLRTRGCRSSPPRTRRAHRPLGRRPTSRARTCVANTPESGSGGRVRSRAVHSEHRVNTRDTTREEYEYGRLRLPSSAVGVWVMCASVSPASSRRTHRSLSASSRSEADSEDHGFSHGFAGGGARLFFFFFFSSHTLRPASASASSSAAAPSEEAAAAAAAAAAIVAVAVAAAAAAAAASAQARSASSNRTAGRIAAAWSPANACSSSRRQRGSSRHRSGTDSTRSRVESCNGFGGLRRAYTPESGRGRPTTVYSGHRMKTVNSVSSLR